MRKDETPEFIAFWNVWRPYARHTDGRGSARETFTKHVKAGADAQDIVDGARHFFRIMKEEDRKFVPLSSTWLNRGAYEDLAGQERAYLTRISANNSNAPGQSAREIYLAAELRRSERSFR